MGRVVIRESGNKSQALAPRLFEERDLVAWGERVGRLIVPPAWIALVGPLGAGKSVLARAIATGAGVVGVIPSPSFTLVQTYRSPRGFEIHHVDLFRLERGASLEPLGWGELLASDGLVIVEWGDRAGHDLPAARWDVNIDYADGPTVRTVTVSRLGESPPLPEW